MHVLLYTHGFPPQVGGLETITKLLAEGLATSGAGPGADPVRVTVATPVSRGESEDDQRLYRVVRRPGLQELVRLLRQADLVHLAGPSLSPLLLSLLLRKPVVVEHHGFQSACPNGQLVYEPTRLPCPGYFMAGRHEKCLHCNDSSGAVSSLKLWLLTFARRWLCARVTANIAPTQSLADTLRLPRTVVIHHGLPAGQPAPLTGPGSEVTTVAFIGRLVTAKGAHLLLEATALLAAKGARVHVRIIGDGPERERLQARAQTLGLMDRVAFLGYVSDERLPEALANVSAIIMPSLGGEVFGLVAAETMLRERCIVSSDLPSLTEVVGDGGLIFPAGDVRGLAACLQQLFERPALPAQLGRQARQRALQLFSLERMVTHHVALYRQVLAT